MYTVVGLAPSEFQTASDGAAFRLGTIGAYEDPVLGTRVFVYGRANAAITGRGFVVVEDGPNTWRMIDSTVANGGTAGHGSRVGVAQTALAANQFGWFQIAGRGPVRTAASSAKSSRINTTSTAGQVHTTGSAGDEVINGMTLLAASGGSAGVNEDGMLSFPTVGATL
ncbi:MAG: hypothetical protein RMK97_02025 [Sutterellaceae bacterium]|nr:hypothetical protein [Burkholderiaceae bacterium]MDW8429272.1 hypothetical protein [Sutterellaceae bacterium]